MISGAGEEGYRLVGLKDSFFKDMGDDEWTRSRLAEFGLEDDVYAEYVHGMVDEDGSPEDRSDAVVEYLLDCLGDAVEKVKLDDFSKELVERHDKGAEILKQEEEIKMIAESTAAREAAEKALKEEMEKEQRTEVKKDETDKERKERNALLEKFGFEMTATFDEDGNVHYKDTTGKGKGSADDAGSLSAHNRSIVKEKDQALRAQQRAAHEQQKVHEKKLLEKQKREEEKKKQKSQKQERRAGRG